MSLSVSSLSRVLLLPGGSERVLFEVIDLRIAAGEALGILGPAGSGKTALVRGLLGLDPLSGGEVALRGRTLRAGEFPLLRRAVLADLVCGLNIAVSPLRLARHAAEWAQCRPGGGLSGRLLREASPFGLPAGRLARPFRALDAGERACALMAVIGLFEPPCVVLDGLESLLSRERETALAQWISARKAEGAAILVASRSEMLLARCCDRVAILFDGTIQGEGPVREVLPAAWARLRRGRAQA